MGLSLILGLFFYFFGKKANKKIDFYEQVFLILLIYTVISLLISIPYYLSNYQISFINSLLESFSGITGTGFSIFENIKYLDPTLILWRSSSQWIGGLYFLIFLILFFSNTQFNFKLNDLVFSDKSLNPETNIKKISLKIAFLYIFLTILIFILFSVSDIRLFNGLNLAMTIISTGGFLPTNSLSNIITNNTQEFFLVLSFLIPIFNVFFIYNLFTTNNILKNHYEDFFIILLIIILFTISLLFMNNSGILGTLANILSSLGNFGISVSKIEDNFSLYFLFIAMLGGSIISNTSGVKFLRIYILLKGSFIEIFKLAKPNNVVSQNILNSDKKIDDNNIKLSFLIFISFFISLFILSGVLLLDNISFENSFKLSVLTLTNTVNSELYGLENIDFNNLLISSKIFLIIFMIVGKIELISIFLIIKKTFLKS
jgi:trk system potassium uptake protein TrkH